MTDKQLLEDIVGDKQGGSVEQRYPGQLNADVTADGKPVTFPNDGSVSFRQGLLLYLDNEANDGSGLKLTLGVRAALPTGTHTLELNNIENVAVMIHGGVFGKLLNGELCLEVNNQSGFSGYFSGNVRDADVEFEVKNGKFEVKLN